MFYKVVYILNSLRGDSKSMRYVTDTQNPTQFNINIIFYRTVLHRKSKPPKVCDDIDMMKMREFSDINQLQFNTRDRSLLQNWNIHSPHDILGPKDQMNAFQFHYQHTSRSLSVIGYFFK